MGRHQKSFQPEHAEGEGQQHGRHAEELGISELGQECADGADEVAGAAASVPVLKNGRRIGRVVGRQG